MPSPRAALPALLLVMAHTMASGSAAASNCDTMVAMGARHEQGGDDDVAIRVYTEALSLDPQCARAYLRLGELRLKRGDALEAKRVLVMAREHVSELLEAIPALARARWALGEHEAAERDLEEFLSAAGAGAVAPPDQARALRQLATWYAEERNAPAQLGAWRGLLAIAERAGDATAAKEARTTVRALIMLVGPADPVTAPPGRADVVRRVIASAARRL
jgi:tetratricopeptide (TPR) repeat protein